MSMAGKMRLSTSRRSRWISMLPVPLNSSKITSSMRLPVSTSAVPMMVRLPPSSMLRAAPKNFLGLCSALESTPPERILPRGRHDGVVGARQARDRVEQDDDVAAVLDQALAPSRSPSRPPARGAWRLVEGRAHDLALDRALHVGDFLGPLVDQQHDEDDLRVVVRDAVAIVLQHHRLAGARRRDDQAALALADRRDQVDDARRVVLGSCSSLSCSSG